MKGQSVRIAFVGDICPVGDCERTLLAQPPGTLFAGIADKMATTDLVVADVECCLTSAGEPMKKKYAVLRAEPDLASKLAPLGVALVANNHVGDFGPVSATDTVRTLGEAGIACVGYGQDMLQAASAVTVTRNGFRIGFIAMSCLTTNGRNHATPDSPGVAPLSLGLLRQAVEECRDRVDVLFFCPHWGVELHHYPVVEQMRVARRAIDWGVDAVVGGHPHVIQTAETYRGKPIFYSLGNLVFPQGEWRSTTDEGRQDGREFRVSPEASESLAAWFSLERTDGGVRLTVEETVPLRFGPDYVPRPVSAGNLSYDLGAGRALTAAYARRHRRALLGEREIVYTARGGVGGVQYFYASAPIDLDGPARRLVAFLARAFRATTGSGRR